MTGLVLTSGLSRAGYIPTGSQIRAGHSAGKALVPYYGSTAVNVPLPGTKMYNASSRALVFNTSSQGPKKQGFMSRMFTRRPKLITMRNLKLRQMSQSIRSGAGRRAMEVINVQTLPSTNSIIKHHELYTKNVVNAAKKAFQNGRKVFSNENFLRVPIFSKAAFNAVSRVQSKNAPELKSKYWVLKTS
jgi:hypothetical protein